MLSLIRCDNAYDVSQPDIFIRLINKYTFRFTYALTYNENEFFK